MTVMVFGYLIRFSFRFCNFVFSVFSLVLGWTEKSMNHSRSCLIIISKHLQVHQKYSAVSYHHLSSWFLKMWSDSPSCLIHKSSIWFPKEDLFLAFIIHCITKYYWRVIVKEVQCTFSVWGFPRLEASLGWEILVQTFFGSTWQL